MAAPEAEAGRRLEALGAGPQGPGGLALVRGAGLRAARPAARGGWRAPTRGAVAWPSQPPWPKAPERPQRSHPGAGALEATFHMSGFTQNPWSSDTWDCWNWQAN